jgi:hypothetical protein
MSLMPNTKVAPILLDLLLENPLSEEDWQLLYSSNPEPNLSLEDFRRKMLAGIPAFRNYVLACGEEEDLVSPEIRGEFNAAWVARKFGADSKVKVSDDLKIFSAGDTSLYRGKEALSMIAPDPEEDAAAALELMRGLKLDANPPPLLIIRGKDEDYVWQEGTILDRIESAPFRCPGCGVRVKHAPLAWQGYDRYYVCLCMCVYFRQDTPSSRSSREWQEIQLRGGKEAVRHRAIISEDKS